MKNVMILALNLSNQNGVPLHFCHEAVEDDAESFESSLSMACQNFDDKDVYRFLSLNLDSMVVIDVTELVSLIWLNDFNHTPEYDHLLPTYVRTSKAWEDWCDEFEENA